MSPFALYPRSWCCDDPALRIRAAAGPLLHRFFDHAAEEEPDVPELVRGKSARVFGHLMALLALMKDSRWPTTATTRRQGTAVRASTRWAAAWRFRRIVAGLEARRRTCARRRCRDFPPPPISPIIWCARACPFRDAHGIVARAVREAEAAGCDLSGLPLAVLRRFSGPDRPGRVPGCSRSGFRSRRATTSAAPRRGLYARPLRADAGVWHARGAHEAGRRPPSTSAIPRVRKLGEARPARCSCATTPSQPRRGGEAGVRGDLRRWRAGKLFEKLFITEASLAGKLAPPAICEIYDAVAEGSCTTS